MADNLMKYYFFNVHLCNFCKSKNSFSRSKLCLGCKLVSYCSSEHQRADWKSHKSICKPVQEWCQEFRADDIFDVGSHVFRRLYAGLKRIAIDIPDPFSGNNFLFAVMELIGRKRKQLLDGFESNMIIFAKRCAVCSERKNLPKELVCTKCFGAAYCSVEHQRQDNHEDICADFQKYLDVNLFMQNADSKSRQVHLIKPEHVISLNLDACDIRGFIANYIKSGLQFEEEAVISFYLTSVLTFSRIIKLIPNFSLSERLTIHIVGANACYEGQVIEHWENVLHLFPNVRAVTIVHIGPRISGDPIKLKLCDYCKTANKSVDILFYSQFYHDYQEGSCAMKKPDVIIAFNSGLYCSPCEGYQPWIPTVPLFFQYDNVAIILTEASESELEDDLENLLSTAVKTTKKVNLVVKCEKNPFVNLKPWKSMDNPGHTVNFDNNYVAALVVKSG